MVEGRYVEARSPYGSPLRREPAQFLIFCPGHKACFVLSLASAGGGCIFLSLPFSVLRSVHSPCLICEFNLLSLLLIVVLHLQLINILQTPWGLPGQAGRSQRPFRWKPISRFPASLSDWKGKGVPNTRGVHCVHKQLETRATFSPVLPGNQLGFLAR